MKSLMKAIDALTEKKVYTRLLALSLLLILVLLITATWPLWSTMWGLASAILKPFIIGFVIAYLIRPAVVFFESRNIKRGISVPLIIGSILLIFGFLFANFFPMLINDLGSLFGNFGDGIESLYQIYLDNINQVPSPIIENIVDQLVKFSDGLLTSLPNIPNLLGDSINVIISVITTSVFSFVIALYIVMDYETIVKGILNVFGRISYKWERSAIVVNEAIRNYYQSFIVIVAITIVEYTLFYFIVGHKYALMMGLLTALGLFIPYVGSIAVNIIGLISGLGLGMYRIIFLVLGIMILPNLDAYLISPFIFKKRNKTNPLWTLFSFFACATIFGVLGALISTPLYFSIRAIIQLRRNNWSLETEK